MERHLIASIDALLVAWFSVAVSVPAQVRTAKTITLVSTADALNNRESRRANRVAIVANQVALVIPVVDDRDAVVGLVRACITAFSPAMYFLTGRPQLGKSSLRHD